MDSIDIGLFVTGGLLVMVVLGMRVAFAAGLAGLSCRLHRLRHGGLRGGLWRLGRHLRRFRADRDPRDVEDRL